MTDIVITHQEIVDCASNEDMLIYIARRLEPTGVFNVASGVLAREDNPMLNVFVYRVSFDPWYWTGRRV